MTVPNFSLIEAIDLVRGAREQLDGTFALVQHLRGRERQRRSLFGAFLTIHCCRRCDAQHTSGREPMQGARNETFSQKNAWTSEQKVKHSLVPSSVTRLVHSIRAGSGPDGVIFGFDTGLRGTDIIKNNS